MSPGAGVSGGSGANTGEGGGECIGAGGAGEGGGEEVSVTLRWLRQCDDHPS